MSRWGIFIAFAIISCGPASRAVEPDSGIQIATGYSIVCLLRRSLWTGGESAVKCWGLGVYGEPEGKEIPVPALNHARAIAASRAAACAIDGDRIRCWGYRPDDDGDRYADAANKAFAEFTHPIALTGGTVDICAIDADRGARCVHNGGYATDPSDPVAGPKRVAPSPYLVQGGYALACAIGSDRHAYCWETLVNQCGSVSDYSTPLVPLVHPRELVVSPNNNGTACRPCVIDENDVRCWGTPEHYAKLTQPSGLHHPSQLTQLDRTQGDGTHVVPCVIDEGKVKCRADNGAFEPFAPYLGFANPVALAANDWVHCAANEQVLECHFGNHFEKKDLRIPHGFWFRPFALDGLADALDHVAKTAYADKGRLYSMAAKTLRAAPAADVARLRAFYLVALKPLVDFPGSEFTDRFLQPNWDKLLAETGAPALSDFAAWTPARLAALELVHAAVPPLQSLRSIAESPQWNACLAALGEALASGASPRSLSALRDRFAPLRERLAAIGKTGRGSAVALTVLELMEILQP